MEKFYEQALLYDFYGELLTPHQRSIYEDAVFNDMSLSEIAEEQGISRQGVHDLIRRCDKILQDYESKLHLVNKFAEAKIRVNEIINLTRDALEGPGLPADRNDCKSSDASGVQEDKVDDPAVLKERMRRIRELSEEIIKDW